VIWAVYQSEAALAPIKRMFVVTRVIGTLVLDGFQSVARVQSHAEVVAAVLRRETGSIAFRDFRAAFANVAPDQQYARTVYLFEGGRCTRSVRLSGFVLRGLRSLFWPRGEISTTLRLRSASNPAAMNSDILSRTALRSSEEQRPSESRSMRPVLAKD